MPDTRQDLTGRVFGHLTVLKRAKDSVNAKGVHRRQWLCQCDCGKQTIATTASLNSGEVTSCGHVRMQNLIKYRERQQETTPGTSLDQLTDKPPVTNKTGYRNISLTHRSGRRRYRVSVQYKRHTYSGGLHDSLGEAIKARDELRRELWPNFKDK